MSVTLQRVLACRHSFALASVLALLYLRASSCSMKVEVWISSLSMAPALSTAKCCGCR